MAKRKPNKRYTGEFKQEVVETMMREKLNYAETGGRFENSQNRMRDWERKYLKAELTDYHDYDNNRRIKLKLKGSDTC